MKRTVFKRLAALTLMTMLFLSAGAGLLPTSGTSVDNPAKVAYAADSDFTIEDGVLEGGFGSAVNEKLAAWGLRMSALNLGVPDRFIEQSSVAGQMAECGLTPHAVAESVSAHPAVGQLAHMPVAYACRVDMEPFGQPTGIHQALHHRLGCRRPANVAQTHHEHAVFS